MVGILMKSTHYSKMPDLLVPAIAKLQNLLSSNLDIGIFVYT